MLPLPNVLLLGASGGVANEVLRRLTEVRDRLGRLVLVSRDDRVTSNPGIDHLALRYELKLMNVDPEADEAGYQALLRDCAADLVIDLTDAHSLPLLHATDRAGVAYFNTAMNDVTPTGSVANLRRSRKARAR
jgi:hypothetical protein